MTFRFLFAWYDLWIGAFWDRQRRILYVLPLPMVGVVIGFPIAPKGIRRSERVCCKIIKLADRMTLQHKREMADYLEALTKQEQR